MSNSAAAFANFPSNARGILQADTYVPLSLHTADVHVLLSGYAAQVTLSLEYVNETNRLVKGIAAYPVPPGFQLQFTTLTGPNRSITDNVYQQSRALKTTEAGGALSTKSLYDIMTSAVATQTVPWDISPGDSLLMTSVYHAPLALIQRQTEIAFKMPTSLFPAVVRPPEEQRNYVKTADDRSSNRRVGKAGWLYLTVEGQLYRPLRGNVTLDKGGYIVVPEGDVELKVVYAGDSAFCLTYQAMLPTKEYTQQALTVRAPVGDIMEPLRLHSVTVPPTETAAGSAAVALTIAPSFANCPVNAELVFLIDVHSAAMAQDVAEAVAAVISPTISPLPDTVLANVLICSDTRRNGCVAVFPTGSSPIATIPQASVLAFMKEEIAHTTSKTTKKGSSLAPAVVYSPQLPAVLHDVLAGRNVATAVPTGYVRSVILLSDAGGLAKVSESAAMICDAMSFTTNTRVHCVALGPAADRAVMETLALTAGGRYRSPATTVVPRSSKHAATCDLVVALREVLVAAAVPCLANVRTTWKLVSKSRNKTVSATSLGTIHLAANENGSDLPCIPRNTKRTLYGLIVPPEPTLPEQQAQTAQAAGTADNESNNNNSNGSNPNLPPPPRDANDEKPPLQLNVRVTGRVGNLALEFTTATLITRVEDAILVARDNSLSTTVAASGIDETFTMSHQDVANAKNNNATADGEEDGQEEAPPPPASNACENSEGRTQPSPKEPSPQRQQPQVPSMKDFTSQENISISPERDNVSAGSASKAPAMVPASSPTKRNGKTLLLHTAAAAARLSYLSNGVHAVSTSEAQEMIELSRRCMLPSPYTTLTDGKAPLTAEQRRGGVVYMPSVGARAQMTLAISTRQAETAAVAPPSPSKSGGKEKDGKSTDKDKKDKKNKDTVSLYSSR
jgi:hypothetical protein